MTRRTLIKCLLALTPIVLLSAFVYVRPLIHAPITVIMGAEVNTSLGHVIEFDGVPWKIYAHGFGGKTASFDDLVNLPDDYIGMEVFNSQEDIFPPRLELWQQVNAQRQELGKKPLWGFAWDDFHQMEQFRKYWINLDYEPGDFPAWMILEVIRNGYFTFGNNETQYYQPGYSAGDFSGEWIKANLHSHTIASDGFHRQVEVEQRYADAGYGVIAITDHKGG